MEVNPFTPQYKAMTAKLVDGVLLYDCPYSGKSYVLVVQNAIHMPSMDNNLIPPFMMREAGIMVNEKAKIHMDNPKDLDHSTMLNSTGFWIPLYLWGIFSYFSTQHPMREDLLAGHDIYVLSPSKWDPHSEVYGQNKANMTNWEGNVKEPKDRLYQVVIDEIETEIDASQFVVLSTEGNIIDKVCNEDYLMVDKWQEGQVPKACDDVNLHLGRVSSVLVDSSLAQQVEEQMNLGRDQIAIGSTVGMEPDEFLDHDGDDSDLDKQGSEESIGVIDDLYDLDQIFMSGVEVTGGKGVGAHHLSKVWRVSHEDAQWMLGVTSQHGNCPVNPNCPRIMEQMTECYSTKRLKSISTWIPFLQPRKGASPLMVVCAANSL